MFSAYAGLQGQISVLRQAFANQTTLGAATTSVGLVDGVNQIASLQAPQGTCMLFGTVYLTGPGNRHTSQA